MTEELQDEIIGCFLDRIPKELQLDFKAAIEREGKMRFVLDTFWSWAQKIGQPQWTLITEDPATWPPLGGYPGNPSVGRHLFGHPNNPFTFVSIHERDKNGRPVYSTDFSSLIGMYFQPLPPPPKI